jgi:hypothetical protein
VYPYAFGWEEPAYRSLLKSADAVNALAARRKLVVVPPTEFQVSRFEDDNVLAGSDAGKAVAARGLPSRAFVALRAWAERIGARTVRESLVNGVVRADLTDETTLVAHVQVIDAVTGEVVVDLSGRLPPDAGGALPGADPWPELTALHRRLVAEAAAALEARLAPGTPAVDSHGLAPAAFEKYALSGSARQEIARYLAVQRAP